MRNRLSNKRAQKENGLIFTSDDLLNLTQTLTGDAYFV